LVIGYTTDFNYDDFLFCTELINKGARLICTDKDNRFAHNGGWLPGTGWIVASLEYVTSQKAIIIGKPKKISISYLMDEMKMMKEDLLMVGDNLDTDIMVAKEVGIPSCLFLGGVSGYNDIARSPNYKKPDMVFDNLRGLLKYFLED
jgi:4-nitrophenyl phosphatase